MCRRAQYLSTEYCAECSRRTGGHSRTPWEVATPSDQSTSPGAPQHQSPSKKQIFRRGGSRGQSWTFCTLLEAPRWNPLILACYPIWPLLAFQTILGHGNFRELGTVKRSFVMFKLSGQKCNICEKFSKYFAQSLPIIPRDSETIWYDR